MNKLLLFTAVCCTLFACKKDQPTENTLDVELESALLASAEGEGLNHFILPEEADLNNIPADPNNPLTPEKVELGKLLFHETGLATEPKVASGKYTYSCASCHHADAGFQAGAIQGLADGGWGFGLAGENRSKHADYPEDSVDFQPFRSPSAMNLAYQKVILWNGQFGATGPNEGTEANWTPGTPKNVNNLGFEGLETQAIAGLAVHRLAADSVVKNNPQYQQLFDAAFPSTPAAQRYSRESMGLAIAAYERTLLANEAPFQQWLKGDKLALTDEQKKGAVLFFAKANCTTCHSGPALAKMEFHALGMKDFDPSTVIGGGPSPNDKKGRGGFTQNPDDDFKFKVPQLYNIMQSPFYGHGSSFTSIRAVIEYKNEGVKENQNVPDNALSPHFKPLNLSDQEIDQLTEFITVGLYDENLKRYSPTALPSGLCFPNNDIQSKQDLDCQ